MFNKAKKTTAEHETASSDSDTSSAPTLLSSTQNGSSARPSTSVIGSHTHVEGDIHSEEDLTIKGRVSGIVTCKQHTVTLGASGYLNGDVFAHTLHVSGEVEGNLIALHRVTIHKGAQVTGTLTSPCVVIEDGSVFHGSIDMSADSDRLKRGFSNVSDAVPPSASAGDTSNTSSLVAKQNASDTGPKKQEVKTSKAG